MQTPLVWSNVQDKFASILVLRSREVHRLKVTGLMLKNKVKGVLEQLAQGVHPNDVGAKAVESIDAGAIAKAEVAPGNGSLTLHRADGTEISYSSSDCDADAILATILERGGRKFEAVQEEVGLVEAVTPPVLLGLIAGVFWYLIFSAAGEHAEGHEVEVKGRRKGVQRMMIMVADLIGYNGALALGAVLAAWVLYSTVSRVVKRPQRTVWLPASTPDPTAATA